MNVVLRQIATCIKTANSHRVGTVLLTGLLLSLAVVLYQLRHLIAG